jgi:hypothetical protein
MPAPADNNFRQVETYQRSALAYLLNLMCFVNNANTKFKSFNRLSANLGSTVTYDKPDRCIAEDGLVANFQATEDRVGVLTCAESAHVGRAFTNEQFIFNAREYMDKYGRGSMVELANKVETSVASVIPGNTYRYYGDGITHINTFLQLAQMLAAFRNYGAPQLDTKGFLSDISVPAIVDDGTKKFVPNRNEKLALSWKLGGFSRAEWFESNLLPTHIAGSVGNAPETDPLHLLTVTSVVTDPDGGISAIVASSPTATDAGAIKKDDLLSFQDKPLVTPIVRYRTWVGHAPSENPVQIRATADAGIATNSITIPIYPKLYSAVGPDQNITTPIIAGMTLRALPSHRCGLLMAGQPLYVAMPPLPDESPFPTANATDPDSNVSIRMYHGSEFGQNKRGMVHDCLWGKSLEAEYAMRIVFPLT